MAKRKKIRKTPGDEKKIVREKKHSNKSQCSICGKTLHGVERGSSKGPKRPYGGELCSKCSKKVLSLRSKLKHGVIGEEEVPISLRKYM